MRCYAPSTSTIAGLLLAGYLTLRHTTGHALASLGLVTNVIIILGCCLLAAGLIVVAAAVIRRRRAAAGGCLTCTHPCQEAVPAMSGGQRREGEPQVPAQSWPAPSWPDRPLTRTVLPVVAVRSGPAEPGAPGARCRERGQVAMSG